MYKQLWGKTPRYPKPYFVGRNGTFECTGFQVDRHENLIQISPLCKASGKMANCLIEIPIGSVEGLINALRSLQDEKIVA